MNIRNSRARTSALLLAGVSAIGLSAIAPAMAQEEEAFALEEIVVTAQKRSEKLHDVPISVAAVTSATIQQSGIKKMEDLQFKVPNFTMSETGIGTNIAIRGIFSGVNQGFEQSVGIYIDGIHYGRAQQSRSPFLDLERVEVLRGPQSILFGKNSIAGALNIITAQPKSDFEGYVQASYEPKYNEFETTGVVTGPLSDKVRFRFAGRYHETDGYMKNTVLNKSDAERDDWQIRGALAFDVTDDFDVTIKAEAGKFNVDGREIETFAELPGTSSSPLSGPLAGAPGLTWAQLLTNAGALPFNSRIAALNAQFGGLPGTPGAGLIQVPALNNVGRGVLDNVQNGERATNGENSHNQSQTYVLTANWRSDAGTLTAISGYSHFKYNELCDCDYTGAEVFSAALQEDYKQFSQEIRFVSEKGGAIDYILGGFFQTSKDTYADQINVTATSLLPSFVYDAVWLQTYAGYAPLVGPAAAIGQANASAPAALAIAGTRAARNAEVNADVWSAFGQFTWNTTDQLRFTFGARFNHEKKDGNRTMEIQTIDGSALSGAAAVAAPLIYANVFGITSTNLVALSAAGGNTCNPAGTPFNKAACLVGTLGSLPVTDTYKKDRFTPSLNMQFDATDDIMLYAAAVMGAKSGGFDYRANNKGTYGTMEDAFVFSEEKAKTFEVGAKMRLFDGRGELNTALYYTDFKDLQISIFDGKLGFNVGNAGQSRVQGFEMDGRFALSSFLTARGSFAYTDFKFKEFDNGQCYFGQTPNGPNAALGQCSYTGQTNEFVAKTSGTLALDFNTDLSDSLALSASADMFYTGKYFSSPTLDPNLVQGAYAKLNLRIAMGATDGGWEIAVLGKNLTDKKPLGYATSTPLAGTFGVYSNAGIFHQGRTFVLQGRVKF